MPKAKRRRPRRSRRSGFNISRFSANQSTIVRLSQFVTIGSNGSGVASGVIFNDPTSSFANFTEHVNDYANIYTEMRLVACRYRFVTCLPFSQQETKTVGVEPMFIAYQQRGTATLSTPTTYDQVADNARSKIWNIACDTSRNGLTISYTAKRNVIGYNATNSSSSPDYAGVPGGIQFYCNGLPLSVQVCSYHQEVFVQYRGRS